VTFFRSKLKTVLLFCGVALPSLVLSIISGVCLIGWIMGDSGRPLYAWALLTYPLSGLGMLVGTQLMHQKLYLIPLLSIIPFICGGSLLGGALLWIAVTVIRDHYELQDRIRDRAPCPYD
jgi:hypothetical protein